MGEKMPINDQLGSFRNYAAEFRSEVDNFVKQVLLISDGIQAITH